MRPKHELETVIDINLMRFLGRKSADDGGDVCANVGRSKDKFDDDDDEPMSE